MASPLASPTKLKTPTSPSSLCPKCGQELESPGKEGVVVSFGDALWHPDCRCSKCNRLVEGEVNLLLLSDGTPVCENCSYNCTFCRLPITTEAIVTGEESYHAECFKCRHCENRIEELVFAKTSQGIYCMSCHNDRVAKSRKHAEAKRSKSLKKSNSSRSPRPTPPASSSHDQSRHNLSPFPSSSQPTPSTARSPLSQQQQLLPTDLAPPKSSTSPLNGTTSPRPEDQAQDARASSLMRPQELSPPAPRNSFAPTEPLRTRTTSDSLTADDLRRPSRSPSPLSRYNDLPAPPPVEKERADSFSSLNSSRRFESLPHLDRIAAGINSSSTANKRNSLAPSKPDRSNNRRSGFYGLPITSPPLTSGLQSNTLAEDPDNEKSVQDIDSPEEASAAPSRAMSPATVPEEGSSARPGPPTPTKDTAVVPPRTDSVTSHTRPRGAKNSSGSDIMPRALSFYDPDLLFDLPNSPPRGPRRPSIPTLLPREPSTLLPREPSLDEDLDSDPNDGGHGPAGHGAVETLAEQQEESSDDDFDVNGLPHDEDKGVSKRVRESLRQSQGGESGSALDLTLVEKLLAELDETKEKMKELQKDYSHMKRTSSQFMAGITSARDSYEREAELRRREQEEMTSLRKRLHEQAQKLVSAQAAQLENKELLRQSTELRTSVFGMEKELSTLKAERDLTMAEMQGMKLTKEGGGDSTAMSEALLAHLEGIKNEHRAALESLTNQRDQICREISDLSRKRDTMKEENVLYESHGRELVKQNDELLKQLTHTRQSIEQMTRVNTRDAIPEANGLVSSARRVEPTAQPVKKFKWGKGRAPDVKNSISHPKPLVGRHNLQPTSILKPVRCEHCSEKMWGRQELRCASCQLYCHSKCAPHYNNIQCNSAPQAQGTTDQAESEKPRHVFGTDLVRHVQEEGQGVPNVVTACIAAVEAFGMDFEGIYRKTGGAGQVKQITQLFESTDSVALDNEDWDISAVTSVLKNYFRGLENPLYTFELHQEFVSVAEPPGPDSQRLDALEEVLKKLPEAHFTVMSTFMLHLHKVQQHKEENKMTPANLGVVFSPTLLRSHLAQKEFDDINFRAKVVELCVEHAPRFFG